MVYCYDMTNIPCLVQRKAYEAAMRSKCPEFRHGCCVFKGKRVFSVGTNVQFKTSPYGSGPHGCVHAEVQAIIRAKNFFFPERDLRGLSLFVVRVNKRGELRNSKPCEDCQALADSLGIKTYWTTGI